MTTAYIAWDNLVRELNEMRDLPTSGGKSIESTNLDATRATPCCGVAIEGSIDDLHSSGEDLEASTPDLSHSIATSESNSTEGEWVLLTHDSDTSSASAGSTPLESSVPSFSLISTPDDDAKDTVPTFPTYWKARLGEPWPATWPSGNATAWMDGTGYNFACVTRNVQYYDGEVGKLYPFQMIALCQYASRWTEAILAAGPSFDSPLRVDADIDDFTRVIWLLDRASHPYGHKWPIDLEGNYEIDYSKTLPMPDWVDRLTYDDLRRIRRTATRYGVDIVLQDLNEHFTTHKEPRMNLKMAELERVNEDEIKAVGWIMLASNVLYSISGGIIGNSWDSTF